MRPILVTILNVIRFGCNLLRAEIHSVIHGPYSKEEVAAMLASAAKSAPDATDYNSSITDLMNVLHLDSSFAARKRLFVEFDGMGKYAGSAEQNAWLHEQVMDQVAKMGTGEA